MKREAAIGSLVFAAVLSGCAINKTVRQVSVPGIKDVCIKRNSQVVMKDFVTVLQSHIEARGMKASIFDGEKPATCRHHVEYTANWRWDFAMYLTYAEINVFEEGLMVGQVNYDARGGGLRPDKWGPTAEKLKVMVDELFSAKTM